MVTSGAQLVKRGGFTLVEVLVILAIISVLSGVLIPALNNQVRKGQVDRVMGDLNSVRSAVTAFFTDVNRYPGDLHDLVAKVAAADRDINDRAYPASLLARWSGPYLDKNVADGSAVETGFAGTILDDFAVSQHANGLNYLTIRVSGLSSQEFQDIDRALDEGNGADAGQLRFTAVGDTMKFLAVPLQ